MSEKKKHPFFNTISIKGWKPDRQKVEEAIHKEMTLNPPKPTKSNKSINKGKRG